MGGKIFKTGLVYLLFSVVVMLLDYLTKQWIVSNVPVNDIAGSIEVIPNFFRIIHVHNHGAAFSFLAGQNGWQVVFFSVIAIAVSCFCIRGMFKNSRSQLISNTGCALIVGGALGNLYDRIAYGYVIDFLDFNFGNYHYPAFNVADCGICAGVFLWCVYELFLNKNNKENSDNAGK